MSAVVVGAVLLGLLGVVLCAGVWIGMSLGIVGWIGLAGLYRYIAGPQSVHRILGNQRIVGACGAAAVHLDGRDSVSYAPVRADVRGPCALAATYPRSPDARQHPRLRHLRLGIRLVRSNLRDDRESRAARAQDDADTTSKLRWARSRPRGRWESSFRRRSRWSSMRWRLTRRSFAYFWRGSFPACC